MREGWKLLSITLPVPMWLDSKNSKLKKMMHQVSVFLRYSLQSNSKLSANFAAGGKMANGRLQDAQRKNTVPVDKRQFTLGQKQIASALPCKISWAEIGENKPHPASLEQKQSSDAMTP